MLNICCMLCKRLLSILIRLIGYCKNMWVGGWGLFHEMLFKRGLKS